MEKSDDNAARKPDCLHPGGSAQLQPTEPSLLAFSKGDPPREIMRLDREGMTYMGQRITDGGEAHRAFLATMALMHQPNTEREERGV